MVLCLLPRRKCSISIHALRGEGDAKRSLDANGYFYFNPRPPWGGRRKDCIHKDVCHMHFNPRPPWGGRRVAASIACVTNSFQSTPSVGRATESTVEYTRQHLNFNPRPPWGGRRSTGKCQLPGMHFNPRPPWGGRLAVGMVNSRLVFDFNPRPPWGGRRQKYTNIQYCVCT